jgi:ankyrin repeat protein
MQHKIIDTVNMTCERFKIINQKLPFLDILTENRDESSSERFVTLENYIKQNKTKLDIRGLEKIFCMHAKIDTFKHLNKYNNMIHFKLSEILKYTMIFRKYQSFFLMIKEATKKQINHTYKFQNKLSKTHSTTNLLAMATIQGFFTGVKKLVSMGSDINKTIINRNNEQLNLIMLIASNRNYDFETSKRQKQIIKTMRYLGNLLPINYVNNQGQSALMIACRSCNLDFVREIILCGANPTLKDIHGDNAYNYLIRGIPNFGVLDSKKTQILELLN